MSSPYQFLPARAFWRSAVAERMPLDPGQDIYQPRFRISRTDQIATAGSCFAQHVGRTLRQAGYSVLDAEPVPEPLRSSLSAETMARYGYGIYSARYGNIYTVRQLLQLLREVRGGDFSLADPVWEKDGRFYDAFRPSVEPDGLESPEAVLEHRLHHLEAVRSLLRATDVMVFTLGLTEAWVEETTGTVYPTAPGTIAGQFDPKRHKFHNFGFKSVFSDFVAVRRIMMLKKPDMRFLITVSPVPLTATASGQHVEVATCYSKSVLRAVCGALVEEFDNVDYFPSFEIITSQSARGMYYEPNLRSVSPHGVERAMSVFMNAHDVAATGSPQGEETETPPQKIQRKRGKTVSESVVCEEALLEAFAR